MPAAQRGDEQGQEFHLRKRMGLGSEAEFAFYLSVKSHIIHSKSHVSRNSPKHLGHI